MKSLSEHWIKLSPVLGDAHAIIRNTRSEQYFEDWDHLTDSWLPVLAIPPDIGPIAGANIGAGIDQLFEACDTEERSRALFDALQALTNPLDATAFTSSMQEVARTELWLKEAVQVHLAVLTSAGFDTLVHSGQGLSLANEWLALWQEALATQNSQQMAHTRAVAHPESYPGLLMPFEEGLSEYQRRFGWTETLAVSSIAAFPFSSRSSRSLLYQLHRLLSLTAPFFRLVCDVALDPTESLNAGLFASAAERGWSIADVRAELWQDSSAASSLERRVRAVAAHRLQEYLTSARGLVETLPEGDERSMLVDFYCVVERVAVAEIGNPTW